MAKTLLIVDVLPAVVESKSRDVARSIGWEVVGEANNGDEAVRKYAELRPAP